MCNFIRRHSVNANAGDQQREKSKGAEQTRGQLRRKEHDAHVILEGRDRRRRQPRIEIMNERTERRRGNSARSIRAHLQHHFGTRVLREGEIHEVWSTLAE